MTHLSPGCQMHVLVRPSAHLAESVVLGAFVIVEADVTIRANCVLAEHSIVRNGCELDEGVEVDAFVVLGGRPQTRHLSGSCGRVRIGKRTVLREGVTVHRPTRDEGFTTVGDDCLLMAHSHVGHDCSVGNGVTIANNVMLAGHVEVGDGVFIGGGAGIHQFVRIGRNAMIGGNASVSYDVPPFSLVAERNEIRGLNLIGMRRQRLPPASTKDLKECFRAVFSRKQRRFSRPRVRV